MIYELWSFVPAWFCVCVKCRRNFAVLAFEVLAEVGEERPQIVHLLGQVPARLSLRRCGPVGQRLTFEIIFTFIFRFKLAFKFQSKLRLNLIFNITVDIT